MYSISSYDGRSSSNPDSVDPFIIGTNTRRSRPSFLDSINTSSISSPPIPKIEPRNMESSNLDFHTMDAQASSTSKDSINAFGSSNGHSLFRHDGSRNNFESTPSFYSTKQNEDFAALEHVLVFLTVLVNWWKVLHLDTLLKGFIVLDRGCCGIGKNNEQITCLPMQQPCSNRDQYVFWDAFHPTEAMNVLMARKAFTGNQDVVSPINIQQLANL